MPKMKTNRGAAKRFRKRKRHLGSTEQVHEADQRAVRRMLPFV